MSGTTTTTTTTPLGLGNPSLFPQSDEYNYAPTDALVDLSIEGPAPTVYMVPTQTQQQPLYYRSTKEQECSCYINSPNTAHPLCFRKPECESQSYEITAPATDWV